MGKKQKRKRTVVLSTASPRTGSTISAINGVEQAFILDGGTGERVDAENDAGSGIVSMGGPGLIECKHLESALNLEKLGTQIARGVVSKCYECSQVLSPTRRDKEGRAKVVKWKGINPSAGDGTGGPKLWICLECGVINCGSSLSFWETSHQSGDGEEIVKMEAGMMQYAGLPHAKQHSLLCKPSHPLVMECGEDLACLCFVCDVKVDYASGSNSASEGQDEAQSKLKLLQDKLAQANNLTIDAANLNDDQGSESKVDEPAEVSSSNSIEAEVEPVKQTRVIKGLVNLGNSCFFNSVMQNLLGVDMLWEHFSVEGSVREGPLTTALRKFFREIDPKSDQSSDFRISNEGASSSVRRTTRARSFSRVGNTYTPRDLFGAISTKAPRFKGFQQHDSHELLRCLLDGLHTEEETLWKVAEPGRNGEVIELAMDVEPDVLGADRGSSKLEGEKGADGEGESMKKKHETFVEKIFGGQLSSTVRCCLCGHSSVVYEPFLDLSLPIPSKQPNKKASVCKDQARVSSGQQNQRLQALGKGSKGIEPIDLQKLSTMSGVSNSWGSGETHQASQLVTQGVVCLPYDSSFRNGSTTYGQDDGRDDFSSLKPENSGTKEEMIFNPAEDQAAQTVLPPVMCLPYVATVWNRSSMLVEDLNKDFGWMDYTGDVMEACSQVTTGMIVHGGPSVVHEELLASAPEAQQSVDKGQQTLDAVNGGSMGFKHYSGGHETFSNFEDIGYSTFASCGSAEELCGMNEIDGSAIVGEAVLDGPSPCPTSEATDNWTISSEGEGQQEQKLETLTSESVPLSLEKGSGTLAVQRTDLAVGSCKQTKDSVTSVQLHSGAVGCEIVKNSQGESVLASEKDQTDFDGVADLFEEGSYGEEKEDGRQAESTWEESSSLLIQLDGFSSVSDSRNQGNNRVKTDEFHFAGNGGVLGLEEEDEEEENGCFPMSLEGCLLAFTKSELLSGENSWGCENCSRQLQARQEGASSLKSLHTLELESRRQDSKLGTQLRAISNSLVQGTGAGVIKTIEVLDGKYIDMWIQTEELPKAQVSSGSIGDRGLFDKSDTLEDAMNGMNLVTVDLVENGRPGKCNNYTSRESWKGEATSCLNTDEIAPLGVKDATLQGDAKAGVSKLKTSGDQQRHFSKAIFDDWFNLADFNVPSTYYAGLMYVDSGKPRVFQPLTDLQHPAENGENNASRNGAIHERLQFSEIKIRTSRSPSQVSGGAVADGSILCSEDERSKVDDTAESAVEHKQVQPDQMQQTVNDGDSYIPVEMELASTNELELRKNGDDHVGEADVQLKLPPLSSGIGEANSNGVIKVSRIRNGMVPEILPATDQSRRMTLRPWNGLSALAGDLSALHDGHTKLLGADRMKSQKVVEEPPKVIVKRDAEKRFLINKAPPILTVHLKRFAQDMCGRLSKLSGHVTFHEWLDVSPFMDQRSSDKGVCRYRLIGILEHSGTMRGGHYVAYVRGPVSRENWSADVSPVSHTWFYISDSHVQQTSLESVLQSEAYLLFYEKCRIKAADCASF